jgi:hypothetical protein
VLPKLAVVPSRPKPRRSGTRCLAGVALFALLQGCASLDPRAEACPDLTGRFASRAEDEPEPLLFYLLEKRVAPPSVLLRSTEDSLLITAGDTKASLTHPADFECRQGARIVLTRRPTTQLKLPPLIDESVIRSYTFRLTESGELALDVHAQRVGRPYGLRLSSPLRLEKTIVWKKLPG